MTPNKVSKRAALLWTVVVLACVAVAVVAAVLSSKPTKEINGFEQCKDAGGAIMESYPEQCAINGKTFTNDAQSVNNSGDEYIGLTEQVALDKARAENKAARVVERDNESLAVTMDFMPGRLNLSVKDGKVYRVQVEGQEN